MIVVTGGAGFIGSALIHKLNQIGRKDIIVVDELGTDDKWKNLNNLQFVDYMEKDLFLEFIADDYEGKSKFEAVFHMGANSSTTEKDMSYLIENNFEYTKDIAHYCARNKVRFIYASSAATYGDGSQGYKDDHEGIVNLRPLNKYGFSKQLFDNYALKTGLINEIVGLKFFNVFGPNEYHKGDMRSMILKSFEQIRDTGKVKLFKSYKKDFGDGEQKRDFVYVKDVVDMMVFFLENNKTGIYNVGTGKARSWNDLVKAVFEAMDKPVKIQYVDMPESIRNQYQYFTQAEMSKIREVGYSSPFTSLEEAVADYVQNYLMNNTLYLG